MTQILQRTYQRIDIPVTDTTNGEAADLNGASAEFLLARNIHSPVLVRKTTGDGVTVSSGGLIQVELTETDTAEDGKFYYECVVTDALGHRSVVCRGNLHIINTNDNF